MREANQQLRDELLDSKKLLNERMVNIDKSLHERDERDALIPIYKCLYRMVVSEKAFGRAGTIRAKLTGISKLVRQ